MLGKPRIELLFLNSFNKFINIWAQVNRNCLGQFREIPWNQSRIYFDNAGDNMTMTSQY